MHFDFTITWISITVVGSAIAVVWRIFMGIKAIVTAVLGLVSFCQRIMREHEQLWKSHCATYELDERTGLPVVINGLDS